MWPYYYSSSSREAGAEQADSTRWKESMETPGLKTRGNTGINCGENSLECVQDRQVNTDVISPAFFAVELRQLRSIFDLIYCIPVITKSTLCSRLICSKITGWGSLFD